MAEKNRKHDHAGDRQELALPVSEGLEPEFRTLDMLDEGLRRLTAPTALLIFEARAGIRMHGEGDHEQQEKGQRQ